MTGPVSELALLKYDVHRWHGRYAFHLLLTTWLQDRAFRPILSYRLCRYFAALPAWAGFLPLLASRFLHRCSQGAIGFELPPSVRAGGGLRVYHGWTLIINDNVVLGNNVTLLHAVTLGGTRKGSPVIEDEVTISAGAIVIGPVTVGRGAIVGAGAVVTKNVPPYTVVAGNPAKVLRDNPEPYVPHAAPVPARQA